MKLHGGSHLRLAASLLLLLACQLTAANIDNDNEEANEPSKRHFGDDTAEVSYAGYSLLRSRPRTESQLATLQSLRGQSGDRLEFWQEPSAVGEPVDVLAAPQQRRWLESVARSARLELEVLIGDVGRRIRRQSGAANPPAVKRANSRRFHRDHSDGDSDESPSDKLAPEVYYRKYQRFGAFERKLQALEAQFGGRLSVEVAGRSSEARPLYLLKIRSNATAASSGANATKPVIFIDALHHAREWVSHSTAMFVAESLLGAAMPAAGASSRRSRKSAARGQRSSDEAPRRLAGANGTADEPDGHQNDDDAEFNLVATAAAAADAPAGASASASRLLDKFDVWLMPLVNPDGYEFSHTSNRLWRKTRSRQPNGQCIGADPNRNYPFQWAVSGSSRQACDQTYAGRQPLSEPETRALASQLDANSNRIKMYVSLHSYSQVILSPWGYTRQLPVSFDELSRVGRVFVSAVARRRRIRYKFGSASNLLYPASGSSDDFAFGHARIPYSYTIELPDTGRSGFLLPAREIIPVGLETLDGIAAMADSLTL